MNNIQKAFKGKAKRGLCMATGGVLDQNSRPIAAPIIQGNADLIQTPRSIRGYNEWGGGGQLTSMDHDAMADMNSLSPSTQPAGNPFYGGAFGNDPRMTASNNPSIQRASVPPPSPRRPAPNTMTPVDELIPSRRGLQMANGGVVVDPVEALLARTKANYGVGNSGSPAAPVTSSVTPAPAPAPQPAQPSGGLFQGAVRSLRDRAAQIDKAAGYAEGGTVVADGGRSKAPTADSVPVNLSHGEAVLPVKTVAALGGPAAVETLIETTNGKPTATRGLRAGGHYSRGVVDDIQARAEMARRLNPTTPPTPTVTATATAPNMAPEIQVAAEKPGVIRQAVDKVAEKVGYSRAAAPSAAPAVSTPAQQAASIRQIISGPNATTIGDVARKVKDVATSPKVASGGAGLLRAGAATAGLEGAYRGMNTDTDDYYARSGIDREASFVPQIVKDTAVRGLGVLSDVGASAVNGVMLPSNLLVHGMDTSKWYDFRDNFADVAAKKGAPAAPAPAKPVVLPTNPLGDGPMMMPPTAPVAAAPAVAAEPNAKPSNDIQRRTIRTPDGRTQTEFYGKDVKQTYTGADGKPTNNWYDTQDYKDSQVRAAKDKELLKTYEKWGLEGDLKSNNEFYQRRGLARQKAFDENNRADAAREVAAANRDIQQQELGIRREDLGLRRAQEDRALAAAQFDREQKILETQRKATEDMDKDEKQAYDAYLPMFTTKGKDAQGNEIDIEDKAAHAAFINAVRHTMAQRNITNPVAGKPISFGSLPKTEQDRLHQRYKAVQRLKSAMGNYPWNADKADSLNLDDFDAVQNPDGTLSFPALEARMKGRTIRARQKDFEYADGPSKWYDPFQTPDNSLLQNLLSKRG